MFKRLRTVGRGAIEIVRGQGHRPQVDRSETGRGEHPSEQFASGRRKGRSRSSVKLPGLRKVLATLRWWPATRDVPRQRGGRAEAVTTISLPRRSLVAGDRYATRRRSARSVYQTPRMRWTSGVKIGSIFSRSARRNQRSYRPVSFFSSPYDVRGHQGGFSSLRTSRNSRERGRIRAEGFSVPQEHLVVSDSFLQARWSRSCRRRGAPGAAKDVSVL